MANFITRKWNEYRSHFRNNPDRDAFIYLFLSLLFIAYSCLSLVAEFLPLKCDLPKSQKTYVNPDYPADPCRHVRHLELLYMNLREADFSRRIIASLFLGSVIGYERRSADRPAGIRTMALTSLGACCFTLGSTYGFEDGPMGWDASRVTAAIPSGVGFLGAGLIWKGFVGEGADQVHQVHGLTTAASIWLSAAVGCLTGGTMYVPATFVVAASVFMLRFGPRQSVGLDEDDHDNEHDFGDAANYGTQENNNTSNSRDVVNPNESADLFPFDSAPNVTRPVRTGSGTMSRRSTQHSLDEEAGGRGAGQLESSSLLNRSPTVRRRQSKSSLARPSLASHI